MKVPNEYRFMGKDVLRSRILIFAVMVTVSATCQENTLDPSSLRLREEQHVQMYYGRCKDTANCIDAGPYTVTVTDIIEGDTPGYRFARLVLRFENLTFRNRYSCCQTGSNPQDNSAVGIGVDRDGKADSQFMLKARESDTASFDLWRHRPPEQQASSYQFAIMIDEIDPGHPGTVLKQPILTFRNLAANVLAPSQLAPCKSKPGP